MKRLAIITARGGSKRIPRKNIRPFLGQPVIGYAIQAARRSGCFDEIMVSTDDTEIAEVARGFGASVPFMRSPANSGDHATTCDALAEVLSEYARRGVVFNQACCIYPTSMFVTPEKLRDGLRAMEKAKASTLVTVAAYSTPIFRALRAEGDRIALMWPEHLNTRSQDLPPAYFDAGQFYWFDVARFLETHVIMGSDAAHLILPASEVQDIDTIEDWEEAELKYELMARRQLTPVAA